MSKLMLIDAAHPEQTRVAVVDGNRVEEFDFESRNKKQIRGNIYLAKVTRVEASLQAAFVEYGGNRHGFLSFNEIHPDYYQIPVRDRERLLKLEEEEERAAEAKEAAALEKSGTENLPEILEENEYLDEAGAEATEAAAEAIDDDSDTEDEDTDVAEEAAIAEEASERRRRRKVRELRRYKIQEVIKPGQVLLVQVSKEERGTKGAALTTYLSLAGRYCVLMPNTARGGGISRKISNAADRKRLKVITEGLDLPKGVGLIIRTAGSKRTKAEILRDYEYLGRLWSAIRETTLGSIAPTLVHAEGGLVRRAVRDLYDRDIEAIYVEGEDAWREAYEFMKMLMPNHAGRVKQYKETFPIFLKHKVEEQLEAVYHPDVRLKSGGYLVIHQTEALVAIDVNSGRSTKERNIEATALKTNLEAADEACRQMRLRDLAGLVVIDFIDMDENKNNRAVEKRMKDALKRDRARIQTGRISAFGLMELSRQRRRASVIEGSSQVCPTCAGLGLVRSVESAALSALQGLEAQAMKGQIARARLVAPTAVALYLLNEKRDFLSTMEREQDMHLVIDARADMTPPDFEVEILEKRKSGDRAARKPGKASTAAKDAKAMADEEAPANSNEAAAPDAQSGEETPPKRRRGRRGGRGRRKSNASAGTGSSEARAEAGPAATPSAAADAVPSTPAPAAAEPDEAARPKRRRRRSRASASKADKAGLATQEMPETPEMPAASEDGSAPAAAKLVPEIAPAKRRPVRRRRTAGSKSETGEGGQQPESAAEQTPEPAIAGAGETARPKRRVRRGKSAGAATSPETTKTQPAPAQEQAGEPESLEKPGRRPVRRRKTSAAKVKSEAGPAPKAAPVAVKNTEAKAPAKPKSRPARRRKTAAKASAAEPVSETGTGETPIPAPQDGGNKAASGAVSGNEHSGEENPAGNKPDKDKKSWWARPFGS